MSPTAKITSRQGPVVSATDGKVNGMLTKFDGALMINRGNRLLILFHLYCSSKHKLSTILMATVANVANL